jgi:hypothetical protein
MQSISKRHLMTGSAALAVAAVVPITASQADDADSVIDLSKECLAFLARHTGLKKPKKGRGTRRVRRAAPISLGG